MLSLPNVTLVTCTNIKIEETIFAMEHSLSLVNFGDSKFITNQHTFHHNQFEVIQETRLTDYDSYSKVILFELNKYIETEFCLIIQHDGFVLNPEKWDNNFLNYDYIGTPCMFFNTNELSVGNGGFSLRSKKLVEIPEKYFENEQEYNDAFPFFLGLEDHIICVTAKDYYQNKGMKFAPIEIARKFATQPYDLRQPKNTFGFHYGNISN